MKSVSVITIDQNAPIGTLIKTSEFWIGVVSVLGILFLIGMHVKALPAVGATGIIEALPRAPLQPSQALQCPKPEATKTRAFYTVTTGDNYWKISKKVCGTGKYFLSIQDQNEARSLQPGDQLTADCSE